MTDPSTITARDLIRAAEQERDLARGRARLLEVEVATLRQQIAELQAELCPSIDVKNALKASPPNADGDVEVEATSGPMRGRKVIVSSFFADAAYFKLTD